MPCKAEAFGRSVVLRSYCRIKRCFFNVARGVLLIASLHDLFALNKFLPPAKKCFYPDQRTFFSFSFFSLFFEAWMVRAVYTILSGELPKNVMQFRAQRPTREDIVEVYLIFSRAASENSHLARLKDVRLTHNGSKYQLDVSRKF